MREGPPIEKVEKSIEQEVIDLAEQVRSIRREGGGRNGILPVDHLTNFYRDSSEEGKAIASFLGDRTVVDAYASVWEYPDSVEFDQRRGREVSPAILNHAREALEIRQAAKEELERAKMEQRPTNLEMIDHLVADFLRKRFDRTIQSFEAAGPEEAKRYNINMNLARKKRDEIHSVLDRNLFTDGEKPEETILRYPATWIEDQSAVFKGFERFQ